MTPIALYPSRTTLKKTAALGGAYLLGACLLTQWVPEMPIYIPLAVALFGVVMIAQTMWRALRPSPSFKADEHGFIIMGKKRRSWDEFRGVRLHTARVGLVPVAKWVVVQTGRSVIGRNVHIKFTHLSAPAAEMAAEISAYAKHAQRKECLVEALSTLPVPPVERGPFVGQEKPNMTAVPMMARSSEASRGPIQTVPSFSARIFRRRNAG